MHNITFPKAEILRKYLVMREFSKPHSESGSYSLLVGGYLPAGLFYRRIKKLYTTVLKRIHIIRSCSTNLERMAPTSKLRDAGSALGSYALRLLPIKTVKCFDCMI